MSPWQILWAYREAFFDGFLVTVELVLLTAAIGTVSAFALELMCQWTGGYVRRVIDMLAFCVAAIPALVILFWLYYPGQALLGIDVAPFWTALFALSLINSMALYRMVADFFADFPQQFVATGLVCGLRRGQIIRYIQVPLLLRALFPRWLDQQVVILQTSLFASLISVEETFRVAQRINAVAYIPVVIYTSMALIFLCSAGGVMYYAKWLRARFYHDFSER